MTQKYIMTEDCSSFSKGEIVVLYKDDGSRCPAYELANGKGDWHYAYKKKMEPYDDNSGLFIIWSPASDKAPSRTYSSHKQARYVARQLVNQNGGVFYVFKATEKYASEGVTKEVL